MIGSKFGNYEIRRHIGSGGMGEVYEATDSKLGRSVAVKVLPEEFNHDTERVARFEREARVLASLNHSAIASVHGFEDVGGRSFLVMEFVPGQTLAERIQGAPLSLDEALAIATQIADALEYAHDKGIVHRDLKPANVKITPDGKVKLLDFGLAKAFESDPASVNLSNSPTLSVAATNVGVILGTAAYMAPEQARGRAVDKRADIWAFGVVLYEMLTRKQLFKGEDLTETLAAVMKEQPTLDDVPARIRPLLRRCLEKDPSRRLRDISGFKLLLESSPLAVVARKSRAEWMGWAAAAGLGVALVAALWVSSRNKTADAVPIQFQVPTPTGVIRYAIVSPDGRHLLMQIQDSSAGAGRLPSLWVRPLDSLAGRELPGTESDGGIPFWQPDNRYVVFSGSDSKLKKIDVTGGRPTTLCTLPGVPAVSGSMNSDGVIIFGTPNHGVMRVSRSGGVCSAVTPSDGNYGPNIFPAFLPDGHRFIYIRSTGQMPPSLFLGSIDLKPEQQETATPLISAVGNPGPAGSLAMMYVPAAVSSAARVLFLRENTIWTQMFDDSRMQVLGEPVSIVEGASIFSASSAALTFLTGTQVSTQLMWLTAKGIATSVAVDAGVLRAIALSPDAERVAVVKAETILRGSPDIWLLDLVAGRQEKFTVTGVAPVPPLWSRDGKYIAYSSSNTFGSTTTKIYRRPADRSSDAELLLESPGTGYVTDWSRDGRFLLRTVRGPKTNNADLTIIALDSKTESPLIASSSVEVNGRFSPDGKWIAYFSNESSRNEVYVRSFTPGTAGEPPHVGPPLLASKGGPPGTLGVFTGGATGPIWRGDSKALAYPSPSGWVTVEMTSNLARPFGEPQPLPANLDPQRVLDITPDFQRVLAAQPQGPGQGPGTANAATVILNWQQMLKK